LLLTPLRFYDARAAGFDPGWLSRLKVVISISLAIISFEYALPGSFVRRMECTRKLISGVRHAAFEERGINLG